MVIYNLVEDLVKLGHEVDLFSISESITSGRLVSIFDLPLRREEDLKVRESLKIDGIGRIIKHLIHTRYDVIHNHIGWRFLPFAELFTNVVTTLHGPLDEGYYRKVIKEYFYLPFISISLNQRKGLPELHYISNIYNGIEVEKFDYNDQSGDYIAFLGRMSPEKGPVEAIKAAKKAGVRLKMAAKIDKTDEKYYTKEVAPLIDGKQIQYIGEVDHPGKVKLLKDAKALILPIQWEEPFGLVFIEAMACGTPVITLDRGSTREVIVNDETGFICQNLDEMAEKIKQVDLLNRNQCRLYVEKNFSREKMAKHYLSAYEKIIETNLGSKTLSA